MKKYLSLLLLSILSLTAGAQTAAFLGIPIDGPIRAFEQKLESKGYTLYDEDVDGNIYTGLFLGKHVDVVVMPGVNNKVALVGAYMPSLNTWSRVCSDFDEYVKMYTAKYGEPFIENDDLGGLTPDTSAFLQGIEDDLVTKRAIYVVDNIFITITVQGLVTTDTGKYQILILYQNDDNDAPDYSDDI